VRVSTFLYQLGALGLFLSAGVFGTDPIRSSLAQHSGETAGVVFLFGFPAALGFAALFSPALLYKKEAAALWLLKGVSFLSLVWLMTWCLAWLTIVSGLGNKGLFFLKYTAGFDLLGLGAAIGVYVSAWGTTLAGVKASRFLMAAGWAVSYASFVNIWIYTQMNQPPGLLWAPAIGGLLTAFSAFRVFREGE
jgi:hypothetical protein